MNLSDIPKHVTEIDPPYLWNELIKKYGIICDVCDDVTPLFHLDYYDGPLTGLFQVGDKIFYAKCLYEQDRKYWASWELTDKEFEDFMHNHKLFQKYVGGHSDYVKDADDNWIRDYGTLNPNKEEWNLYYNSEDRRTIDVNAIHKRDFFGITYNPFRNW